MIKSVKGSATRQFVETQRNKLRGLDSALALQRLAELNKASKLSDLGRLNSVGLHKLKGDLKGYWSIDLNGPWRILFKFHDGDAYEVHIHDPH
jgi:proteic killer suppression protein